MQRQYTQVQQYPTQASSATDNRPTHRAHQGFSVGSRCGYRRIVRTGPPERTAIPEERAEDVPETSYCPVSRRTKGRQRHMRLVLSQLVTLILLYKGQTEEGRYVPLTVHAPQTKPEKAQGRA